jgi:hypothetical protein
MRQLYRHNGDASMQERRGKRFLHPVIGDDKNQSHARCNRFTKKQPAGLWPTGAWPASLSRQEA